MNSQNPSRLTMPSAAEWSLEKYHDYVADLSVAMGRNWDVTDPVAMAILSLVEAQNALVIAQGFDPLIEPKDEDLPIAQAKRARAAWAVVRALDEAIAEARDNGGPLQ